MIETIGGNSYQVKSRGHVICLTKEGTGWNVQTKNASTAAYNRGIPSYRHFKTLEDVEKAYKTFRGITLLVEADATEMTRN